MPIYLNNAATTWPKPDVVASAMYEFITNHGANLSRGSASKRDIESLDSVFSCRSAVASFFGGYERRSAKYVTFTSNVTESINVVVKGILKAGMRVVTSSMEHNAVMRPLRSMEALGVDLEIVRCNLRGYLDPHAFDLALADGADLAIISHCSNVCGAVQDIGAIAEVCSRRGVPLAVDCAQTAGVVPIEAEALGLSALCFTGHKGLFGPQGTGGIVWNPEFASRCLPLIEGGTGSFSHEERQPSQLPDKFEAGTPNIPGIVGLLAALEWINKTGMDSIRAKEEALAARLEDGLAGVKGLKILGPGKGDLRLPVFSVNIEGFDNAYLALGLSEKYGIETRPGLHCAPIAHRTLGSFPEGALRLSPGYFNSEEEIDITIDALKELAKR